jgi:hypothetical protein
MPKSFAEKRDKVVEDKLTAVFFDLMRDNVPFGKLEAYIRLTESCPPPYVYDDPTARDGARLARNMARRILKESCSEELVSEKGKKKKR